MMFSKRWTAITLAVGAALTFTQPVVAEGIFDTSDSQFTAGVDNQGWWSNVDPNNDGNSNYWVTLGGDFRYRNFFTFDLSSLTTETITAARLELRRFESFGEPFEDLAFFDVSTDAATLNFNNGASPAIFDDLGTGTPYGAFTVPTSGSSVDLAHFALNADAVADINAAKGGFFSVGGALVGTADHFAYLFGSSNNGGEQRLVVCYDTDPDEDADGVCDAIDNCPTLSNPDQQDSDVDGLGDLCDPCPFTSLDSDGDGLCNSIDICPFDYDPDQLESDGDGVGDACDNCPSVYNPDQIDQDFDGLGDVCDPCPLGDDDGDNVCVDDNCPIFNNPDQADTDGDGVGDVCDNCQLIYNPDQQDSDFDIQGDVCDATPFHELVLDSVKASPMVIKVPGSAKSKVTVTVQSFSPHPEQFTVEIFAENVPPQCNLLTPTVTVFSSVGTGAKKTVSGQIAIACSALIPDGTHFMSAVARVTHQGVYNGSEADEFNNVAATKVPIKISH